MQTDMHSAVLCSLRRLIRGGRIHGKSKGREWGWAARTHMRGASGGMCQPGSRPTFPISYIRGW